MLIFTIVLFILLVLTTVTSLHFSRVMSKGTEKAVGVLAFCLIAGILFGILQQN